MVALDFIYARQHEAITALFRDVIERLDPERGDALRNLTYGRALPNTSKQPDVYATCLTEAVLVLAKRVAELEQELASEKEVRSQRRGGRPKNVA